MENNSTHKLPFREEDRKTFEFIKENRKMIETRAGSPEYLAIKEGDDIVFKLE